MVPNIQSPLLQAVRRAHSRRLPFWMVGAALLTLGCNAAHGQAPASGKNAASPITSIAPALSVSRPTWNELTASQKGALAPLATHWSELTEGHKRKWIALSRNFSDWPPEEQARVHGRMSAWAALSTPERNQARVNFAEARKVDRDEKMARWEAYQALSDEQRDKLASVVVPRRPGVAVAAKPPRAPTTVKLLPTGADPRVLPRVGLPASGVDHNTLLPQPVPAP